MDAKQKDGNVAGAILIFVGIVVLIIAFDAGWGNVSGKVTGWAGIAGIISGIGCFLKPEWAESVVHWLNGLARAQQEAERRQYQNKSKNSPQIQGDGNHFTINYSKDNKDKD